MGEVVDPKSTLKHLFGTGKDSQVSPEGAVLGSRISTWLE
jgi:hypothetical protein